MKKTIIITLITLLLLAPAVIAGEIFNGEIHDNEFFTVDNVKHIGRYYGGAAKKISLKAHVGTENEQTKLVSLEDCEKIYDWTYCFDSVDESFDEDTGDPLSISTIRITESGPSLDIDFSISDEEPNVNEEVEVEVTITNNGNERASNIIYTEPFPSSVDLGGSHVDTFHNEVAWTGSINSGEFTTFTYRITFQDFITYESEGEASYYFNNKVYKVKTEKMTYEVQKPYSFTRTFSTLAPAEGEEVVYTLNISNNDSATTLDITKIEITLPSGFVVTNRDLDLKEVGGSYRYTGQLSAGSEESLTLKFKSTKKGQHNIKTDLDFGLGNLDFSDTYDDEIRIGISNIVPSIDIDPNPAKGGKEIVIEAKIINNGDDTISNIWLDLSSDILEVRGWRTIELGPDEKHYAYNKILNAPYVDEETEYYITLSGSYKNDAGKTLEYEATETFSILPSAKVIELVPEFSVTGQEVTITLKAKNIATYAIKEVSLIDSVPSGFSMVEGDRYVDVESLGIGEETSYTYTIKIPDTYTKDSFEITHTFNGNDQTDEIVVLEQKSTVDISGATPAADSDDAEDSDKENVTTEDAEDAEEDTEIAEEKKPGIFKRMWGWIKGLFSSDDADEETKEETEEEIVSEPLEDENDPEEDAEDSEEDSEEEGQEEEE